MLNYRILYNKIVTIILIMLLFNFIKSIISFALDWGSEIPGVEWITATTDMFIVKFTYWFLIIGLGLIVNWILFFFFFNADQRKADRVIFLLFTPWYGIALDQTPSI